MGRPPGHTDTGGQAGEPPLVRVMDLTVYGRQETWEDSPPGWPQQCSYTRTDGGAPDWPQVSVWPGGRPIAQWPRLAAGRSDDLTAGHDGR